jgi:nitrogen fixation protein FixH
MTSADGAPLTGMAITGALRRAATDREDITLAFVETQAGEYRARLEGLGKGGWVLRGEAARGADRFELTGRLAW